MLPVLDTYDWEEVFKYATPTICEAGHAHGPEAIVGDVVSAAPFTRDDVAEVLHLEEGEQDGDHWIAVFRLRDGRFVSIRAWCDYTGWG
jgi:hypothetical protein